MSVRVTIQGSCLICIGQLFLCESTGICCCSGAITVVCCCCICRSICCCCVRRTICCCITGICICCRLSCCITGICICLCCILYRSLLWSCFLQCGIPKDLERFYCGFNRSKCILCFYSGVDRIVLCIICEYFMNNIKISVALVCIQHFCCIAVYTDSIDIIGTVFLNLKICSVDFVSICLFQRYCHILCAWDNRCCHRILALSMQNQDISLLW